MAGKPPIKKISSGNIEACVWESDYKGNKSYAFTFQKNKYNEQTKQWENSQFIKFTELGDLLNVVMALMKKRIKEKVIGQKEQVEPEQNLPYPKPQKKEMPDSLEIDDQDVPF